MTCKTWHWIWSFLGRILLSSILATSCSKKNHLSQSSQNNKSAHPAVTSNQPKLSEPSRTHETSEISKSLKNYTPNADVIEVVSRELKTFDHPELYKQAAMEELATALKGESPLSLRDELHDPNSRWNEDPTLKGAVVGRLALLTGLIGGAGESYPIIPELFLNRSHQNNPTTEDALTLRIVDLASTISEQKIAVSPGEFKVWEDLAGSPNVCHRQIALLLFGSLRPTSEQAEQFFSKYLSESDVNIAEKFITTVAKSSELVDPKAILMKFRNTPAAKAVMPFLEAEINGLPPK